MAKGLDPKMVLVRLGTRDDLVAKFLKDNKKFDQERAEEEVSPPPSEEKWDGARTNI